MDGADISWHDAFKCQLSEICFYVSLRVHTEVRRAFIKRSCTFVHFRPLVRFFYGAFRPNFIPKRLSGTIFHALPEYRIQTHYSCGYSRVFIIDFQRYIRLEKNNCNVYFNDICIKIIIFIRSKEIF